MFRCIFDICYDIYNLWPEKAEPWNVVSQTGLHVFTEKQSVDLKDIPPHPPQKM